MVGMFMMQSMAIYPGNRIHIDGEGVVHDGNGFYKPFLVVERTMSDSQMKNVGQIQAAHKPTKNEINCADQHPDPGSQMSWGEIQTSQHVGQNNQITCDVVDFHDDSRLGHSNRNRSAFQMTSWRRQSQSAGVVIGEVDADR